MALQSQHAVVGPAFPSLQLFLHSTHAANKMLRAKNISQKTFLLKEIRRPCNRIYWMLAKSR